MPTRAPNRPRWNYGCLAAIAFCVVFWLVVFFLIGKAVEPDHTPAPTPSVQAPATPADPDRDGSTDGTGTATPIPASPTPSAERWSPPPGECQPGDDNCDHRIDEDESGWNCRTMGNRECANGREA